jgi:small ligand-binding sensory domain FIST
MTEQMKWTSALSTRPSLEAAVREVVEQAQRSLGTPADLGLVFISSAFASEYSRLMPLLEEQLSVPILIGCSGGGVVGTNVGGQAQEIEQKPALSLSLAYLPDLDSPPNRWVDLIGVSSEEQPSFILLSDPFSSSVNDLLQGLDFAYPGSVKVGGLATAGAMLSRSSLFCNYRLYQEGTVGVALSGNILLEAIVAQGCRPIGQLYRVVEGDRNILLKLEEQTSPDTVPYGVTCTPLEALQELFQSFGEEEREFAQQHLFIGIAQSEFKQHLEQGDFLIRNLLGVDPRNGALAIGDRVRLGQRIQFHLRDADASASDLKTLLERYQTNVQPNSAPPVGALLFACMGRGAGLYGEPNFDSQLFQHYLNNVPLSGFFCSGEIGPIGSTTFLHGYTSVFGICRGKGLEG